MDGSDDGPERHSRTDERLDLFETSLGPAFGHVAEVARLSLRMPLVGLSVIDGTHRRFFAAGADGLTEISRDRTICSEAVPHDRVLTVEDTQLDPRLRTETFVTGPPGIRSYIGAPLLLSDDVRVGTICAAGTEPRGFEDADRALITNLARCAATEIELRQRALRDDLTGFLSRGAFLLRVNGLLDDYRTRGRMATLAFLDIDHFKSVNDRFGHGAGDRVLRTVADTCKSVLGPGMFYGRLGGEEFAIAMPDLTLDDAVGAVEGLRRQIAATTFSECPALRITGSFGVSAIHGGIASVSVWCKMADAALYGAKHAGRNRVIVFRDALGLPGSDTGHSEGFPFGAPYPTAPN